jgi:hypothetical protein
MGIKIDHAPYPYKVPITRKYPFGDMAVDERLTVPVDENELPSDLVVKVRAALAMWKRRTHNTWMRFQIKHDKHNVYVYRLPDVQIEE